MVELLLAHVHAWCVEGMHAGMNMWRPEVSFEDSGLFSSLYLGGGRDLGSPGLQGLLDLLSHLINHFQSLKLYLWLAVCTRLCACACTGTCGHSSDREVRRQLSQVGSLFPLLILRVNPSRQVCAAGAFPTNHLCLAYVFNLFIFLICKLVLSKFPYIFFLISLLLYFPLLEKKWHFQTLYA